MPLESFANQLIFGLGTPKSKFWGVQNILYYHKILLMASMGQGDTTQVFEGLKGHFGVIFLGQSYLDVKSATTVLF